MPLRDSGRSVVLCVECQQGIIGADSVLPALRNGSGSLIEAIGRLLSGARAARVSVVHATYEGRMGGHSTGTAPMWRMLDRRTGDWCPGHPATAVLPELSRSDDVVMPRHHGLCPTKGTELMPVLRGWAVENVILVGVSMNVALPLTAGDLSQGGFEVVVPADAVGGTPPEYTRQVLRHTMPMLATLSSIDELLGQWQASDYPDCSSTATELAATSTFDGSLSQWREGVR